MLLVEILIYYLVVYGESLLLNTTRKHRLSAIAINIVDY